MIDTNLIGTHFPPVTYEVTRSKIRELASALGDTNAIYHDLAVAQQAGYPDLPAPPTFATLFAFWPSNSMMNQLETIGVELRRILHGEEEYEYHTPLFAGDVISGETILANVRNRRGMSFVNLVTTYTNQRGETTVVAKTMILVRNEL